MCTIADTVFTTAYIVSSSDGTKIFLSFRQTIFIKNSDGKKIVSTENKKRENKLLIFVPKRVLIGYLVEKKIEKL